MIDRGGCFAQLHSAQKFVIIGCAKVALEVVRHLQYLAGMTVELVGLFLKSSSVMTLQG